MDTLDNDLTQAVTLSECFGPTLQGEGPSAGRPAMFVRLGLCNLDCRWCDTPYTWDWSGKNGTKYIKSQELERTTCATVLDRVVRPGWPKRVVVSGGEPLVQGKAVASLVRLLTARDYAVEVETNGTLSPQDDILDLVQWNVSPKLAGSGVDADARYNPDAINVLVSARTSSFKFVITVYDDINEVLRLVKAHNIPHDRVYLMPEGRTAPEINGKLTTLFEVAADLGMNVSTRLHVLAYGDRRGI